LNTRARSDALEQQETVREYGMLLMPLIYHPLDSAPRHWLAKHL
jgi:hypothetical protein